MIEALRPNVGTNEWTKALLAIDKRPPLTPAVVAVALVLSTYATWTDGSNARPSCGRIAKGAGTGRDTAGAALKTLVRLGWIQITSGKERGLKTYRLVVPGATAEPALYDGSADTRCGLSPHDPVLSPPVNLHTEALYPTVGPTRNPSPSPSPSPEPVPASIHRRDPDPWDEPHARAEPPRSRAKGSRRVGDQY